MAARQDDASREALLRLPQLDIGELREKWRRLYGTVPPARIGRELLVGAVAHRLQEQALGGLPAELHHRLRQIAENTKRGAKVAITVTVVPRLKPGTRLIREWQGHTYEVLVCDNGFVWRQQQYRSLSEIARAITGTRWSGPVFFGLKPRTGSVRRTDAGSEATG